MFVCSGCSVVDYDAIISAGPQIWETSSFYDKSSSAEIKMRKTYISYNSFYDKVYADISCVVTIHNSLQNPTGGQVYISFLDTDGFEIHKRYVGSVVSNYYGTLRSSFSLPYEDCNRIGNAVLELYY